MGVLHGRGAVALLLGGGVAGGLWSSVGAPATFLAGAVFALVACLAAMLRS